MSRVFNTIRQRLLAQNRFTRYLIYAVGEIVLVVIGILIALQINTWNENRKNKNTEKSIVRNLHQEFLKNKDKLHAVITYHRSIMNATSQVMQLIGESEELLAKHNTDSLIYLTLDYDNFSPSQSVISELISSGKLNLVSSDSLRMLIFEWVSTMEDTDESYATLDEMTQTLTLPYLANFGSMKDIDQYGLLKKNGRSKFEPINHKLFQELEFENHMDNQAWGITNYLMKLEKLETIIDEVLEQTKPKGW